MENAEYARELRRLAMFFEDHPNVPNPGCSNVNIWVEPSDLPTIARELGSCEKVFDEHYYQLQKQVGEHRLDFFTGRENVCEKVAVGKRILPATVVPEHEEIVYEFRCPDSLLNQ